MVEEVVVQFILLTSSPSPLLLFFPHLCQVLCKGLVITCDRDEKVRASHYPNCYNIDRFYLGHKEYVQCMCTGLRSHAWSHVHEHHIYGHRCDHMHGHMYMSTTYMVTCVITCMVTCT